MGTDPVIMGTGPSKNHQNSVHLSKTALFCRKEGTERHIVLCALPAPSLWLKLEKAGEMKCEKTATVRHQRRGGGVGTDPTPECLTRSDGGTEKGECGVDVEGMWGQTPQILGDRICGDRPQERGKKRARRLESRLVWDWMCASSVRHNA